MKRRIVKCLSVFVLLVIFIVCAGILFPENTVITTESENVVSERILVPCGNSVGIQMDVKGALVVGTTQDCDAQIGDMIIRVNNQRVNSPEEVAEIVSESEQTVKVEAVRDGDRIQYALTPYYDEGSSEYKLGLWIKEKIAGIGTLTFYDPRTDRFVALGHGIYEPETGTLLEVEEGKLLNTNVDQVKVGKKGEPGEIGGTIYNFEHPLGNVIKNTEFGVFCTANDDGEININNPMVMATPRQVKKGDAYILTTVDGTRVERFDIKITRVRHQRSATSKSMEFQVTDERLLAISGGIVQGMSGSPIIQNDRLVGAVTHVMVNDPTRGYCIFIVNMLEGMEQKTKGNT